MKYIVISFFFLVTVCKGIYSQPVLNDQGLNDGPKSIVTINTLDTVVFDLSQAVITMNSIAIPVYILSNDTVNALDFSMKYDHANLVYDSVETLAGYLQSYSYYNTQDSTIRFTSNSMHRYANDSVLVAIRFTILNGQINVSDLSSIVGYLNGDPCSIKMIGPIPNAIKEVVNNNPIDVFPNPVQGLLHITANENSTVGIFDFNGKEIRHITGIGFNSEINLAGIHNGPYLVKISNGFKSELRKIIIENY